MQFLTIIKTVLALLPVILETVRAIETALPGSGQGAQKLALVRAAVEAAFGVVKDATTSFDVIWPALEKIVASAVGLFNSNGLFKKG